MDRQDSLRIISRLESLAENPRPPGCAKLEGASRLWRIRVGNYRVVYEIDETSRTVDVSIVRHRRDVYRF
jgi:mRNA interferase RelE/StbE